MRAYPSKTFFLVTVLVFVRSSVCQNVFPGSCPSKTATDLLNVKEIHGTWYEVERSSVLPEFALKCVSIRVQQFFNQEAHVMVKAVNRFSKKKSRHLVMVKADPDFHHSGKLTRVGPVAEPGLKNFFYQVLSTDYKNYMILWGCQNFVSSAHGEGLWIYARSHRVSTELSLNITDHLKQLGLTHLKLQAVSQRHCS